MQCIRPRVRDLACPYRNLSKEAPHPSLLIRVALGLFFAISGDEQTLCCSRSNRLGVGRNNGCLQE